MMNMVRINGILIVLFILFVTGCDKPLEKSQYVEVILQKESKSPLSSEPSTHDENHMPTGDLQTSLAQMPDDAIHRGLKAQMPQDDIHKNLNMPSMETQDPQMQQMLMASVAETPLSWKVPEGWAQVQGSSMRLATFRSTDEANAIECSIVSLAGTGGGIAANVSRWMQQIGLEASSESDVEEFISKQSSVPIASGQSVTVFDFTVLQMKDDPASMMASILSLPNAQIYIKMTGSKKAVQSNSAQFKELIGSLTVN